MFTVYTIGHKAVPLYPFLRPHSFASAFLHSLCFSSDIPTYSRLWFEWDPWWLCHSACLSIAFGNSFEWHTSSDKNVWFLQLLWNESYNQRLWIGWLWSPCQFQSKGRVGKGLRQGHVHKNTAPGVEGAVWGYIFLTQTLGTLNYINHNLLLEI